MMHLDGYTVFMSMDWVFRSFADAGTDIRVNDQFRITFRLEDGGAWEVRCEDYH